MGSRNKQGTVYVVVALDPEVAAAVEEQRLASSQSGTSSHRTDAIRYLIELGLEVKRRASAEAHA